MVKNGMGPFLHKTKSKEGSVVKKVQSVGIQIVSGRRRNYYVPTIDRSYPSVIQTSQK